MNNATKKKSRTERRISTGGELQCPAGPAKPNTENVVDGNSGSVKRFGRTVHVSVVIERLLRLRFEGGR